MDDRSPREIAALRGRARSSVLHDLTLSIGARALYWYLDDEARVSGETAPLTQEEIAKGLGVGVRSVSRWLEEIEGRYVKQNLRSHGAVFALRWADKGPRSEFERSAKLADHCAPGTPNLPMCSAKLADHTLIDISTVNTLRVRTTQEQSEKLAWMVQALRDYPGAAVLGAGPDEEIARACLDIGEWDTAAIGAFLRSLWVKQRAKPGRSWAWFPAVMRRKVESA